jgi:hypothetical protein
MKWGIERSRILDRMSELPACGNLIRRQYDRCLRLKYEVNWRWIRNPASCRSFRAGMTKLNSLQRRLVEDLMATGVATCQFNELFQDRELWQSLSTLVSEFSSGDEVQSEVSKRQRDFEEKHDLQSVGNYIITYYDPHEKPLIAPSNLLLNLVLNPLILDVVNSYFGLWSKLIYFDMWYTLPLNTDSRILSQRWHRDPEDRRKVRTFLYFSEVDEASGAMEYLTGSHFGGPYEQVFQWVDPLGIPYPPDGEVERRIPASQRVVLEGPPGTLIFCDTAGFHRGGTAKIRPRILATSAFVTPASLHGRRYEIDATMRDTSWSPPASFAVM